MKRLLPILALAAAYFVYSNAGSFVPKPVPTPAPATGPIAALVPYARQMDATDRQAMSQAYEILAKALDGDPRGEPCFHRVESVRSGHRAALEVLWIGVLGNSPAKYPGLGPKLEELLAGAIGSTDVPLSEPMRTQAINLFRDIAFTLK